MKKIIWLVLILILCFSLSACGSDKNESSASEAPLATIEPTTTPEPQMAKIVEIKQVEGGLNVRASASTDGEVLGLANTGEKFRLLVDEVQNGWYQIQFNSKVAFVYAEYVTVKEVTVDEANNLSAASPTSSAETAATPTPTPTDNSSSESASSDSSASSSDDTQGTNNLEDGQAR